MKESAKAQHEVDKANMAAVKAESKAQQEESKAIRNPEKRKAILQAKRDEQIAEVQKRIDATNERIAVTQATEEYQVKVSGEKNDVYLKSF